MRRLASPGTVMWSIFIDRPFSWLFFSQLAVSCAAGRCLDS